MATALNAPARPPAGPPWHPALNLHLPGLCAQDSLGNFYDCCLTLRPAEVGAAVGLSSVRWLETGGRSAERLPARTRAGSASCPPAPCCYHAVLAALSLAVPTPGSPVRLGRGRQLAHERRPVDRLLGRVLGATRLTPLHMRTGL